MKTAILRSCAVYFLMITDHSCAAQNFYPELLFTSLDEKGVFTSLYEKGVFVLYGEYMDDMNCKLASSLNGGEEDCWFIVPTEFPKRIFRSDQSNSLDGNQQVSNPPMKIDRNKPAYVLSRRLFISIFETSHPTASCLILNWETDGKLRLQLIPARNQAKKEKQIANPGRKKIKKTEQSSWSTKVMEHEYLYITIGANEYQDKKKIVFFDFGSLKSTIPEAAYNTIVGLLGNRVTSSNTFDCELAEKDLLPDIIINLDKDVIIELKKKDYVHKLMPTNADHQTSKEKCILALKGHESDEWIIGAPIIKSHPMRIHRDNSNHVRLTIFGGKRTQSKSSTS